MDELTKKFRCKNCLNLFPAKNVVSIFFCRECINEVPGINKLPTYEELFEEDIEDENELKIQLLQLHDYLMADKMGEALFLLGRIIGNLENGEYIYGCQDQKN